MADDVEGQLPRLGAQQLGLQEGGPLLLQQLVPAHVVLGPRGRSQSRLDPPPVAPPPSRSHWAVGARPRLRRLPSGSPDGRPRPRPRPGRRPCRLWPPATCGASRRTRTRWPSPRRRSTRSAWKGWRPRRRRPLRGGAGRLRIGSPPPTPPRAGCAARWDAPRLAGGGAGGACHGGGNCTPSPKTEDGGVREPRHSGLVSALRARPDLGWGLGSLRCNQRRKLSVLRTGWGPSVRIRMGSLPRKLFMVPE